MRGGCVCHSWAFAKSFTTERPSGELGLTTTLSGPREPVRASLLFGGPRRQTQFSVLSPTTRPKCLALFVTNVAPNDRA